MTIVIKTEDGFDYPNYNRNPSMEDLWKPSVGMETTPQTTNVDSILDERGKRYGKFVDHAHLAQALKVVVFNSRPSIELAADQREALEMICHKIARIINGDPDYVDNWVDIAGYAKLVADRLEGKTR